MAFKQVHETVILLEFCSGSYTFYSCTQKCDKKIESKQVIVTIKFVTKQTIWKKKNNLFQISQPKTMQRSNFPCLLYFCFVIGKKALKVSFIISIYKSLILFVCI